MTICYTLDMTKPIHVLFICSRNRRRSPTAEDLYSGSPSILAASAGTSDDAEEVVSLDLIEWADIILPMESRHKKLLQRKFPAAMRSKRCSVLAIADNYDYMDPVLVELIESKTKAILGLDPRAGDEEHSKQKDRHAPR